MTAPHNDMIGRVIDIVGIAIGDRGRSCEEHVTFCGVVLGPDVLVRLVKEEIFVEGKIEVVVSAYWVTDSVERCRVGFLPRFLVAKMQTKSMDCLHRSPRCLTAIIQAQQLGRRCTKITDFVMQQSLTHMSH